jgi:hypothetical protein
VIPDNWNVAHLNPPASTLGAQLQHRARPSGARLSHASRISSSVADLNQRKPSVTDHVDKL